LSDLSNNAGSANSSPGMSDDEDDAKFFAGGEKSGLAVQNPDGHGARGGRLISDIFRQAQQNQMPLDDGDEDEGPPQPQFRGTGFTLGTEDVPSQAVRDPDAEQEDKRPQKVVRRLTFWRDGFSVEDGPLYRYDDPANMQYLQQIKSGQAPLALLNVQNGESVDVHISRRMTEDYQPPKRPLGGFSGQGFRLGSPVPGELRSRSASPQPGTTRSSVSTGTSGPSSRDPTGTGDALVQIRLGDGSVLRCRFESTGAVQQLYDRIDAAPATAGRAYVLQLNFPRKELTDRQQSLKEAGAVGAVVTQKWL
jgi:UBX domain-containing protein 1